MRIFLATAVLVTVTLSAAAPALAAHKAEDARRATPVAKTESVVPAAAPICLFSVNGKHVAKNEQQRRAKQTPKASRRPERVCELPAPPPGTPAG